MEIIGSVVKITDFVTVILLHLSRIIILGFKETIEKKHQKYPTTLHCTDGKIEVALADKLAHVAYKCSGQLPRNCLGAYYNMVNRYINANGTIKQFMGCMG